MNTTTPQLSPQGDRVVRGVIIYYAEFGKITSIEKGCKRVSLPVNLNVVPKSMFDGIIPINEIQSTLDDIEELLPYTKYGKYINMGIDIKPRLYSVVVYGSNGMCNRESVYLRGQYLGQLVAKPMPIIINHNIEELKINDLADYVLERRAYIENNFRGFTFEPPKLPLVGNIGHNEGRLMEALKRTTLVNTRVKTLRAERFMSKGYTLQDAGITPNIENYIKEIK